MLQIIILVVAVAAVVVVVVVVVVVITVIVIIIIITITTTTIGPFINLAYPGSSCVIFLKLSSLGSCSSWCRVYFTFNFMEPIPLLKSRSSVL